MTTPEAFAVRWQRATGSELANAQLFVTELCELLDLSRPDPATGIAVQDAYVFERRTHHRHGDGSANERRIDCYRRGCFILEAKKIRAGVQTKGFDDARVRARAQAEAYARDIPAEEGRPPLLLVVDVGHFIELYSEFTRSGATYVPFPDPRSHRIALADLHRPEIRERLRTLWLDPLNLNPARQSAKVTREVASALAAIAKSLEAAGHPPQLVAEFLTRCLFTFFAEDVLCCPGAASPSCWRAWPRPRSNSSRWSASCGAAWMQDASASPSVPMCCASTASCSRVRPCCRSPASRSRCSSRPRRKTGATSNPPSSARCWSARSTRASVMRSARTTRRAPTSSASCCPA